MSDWAKDYFDCGYVQRWGSLPITDKVRRETAGLSGLLQLSSGACVGDLGCGTGRHALAFAELGARVVGVDFALSLLRQANRSAVERGLSVRWVRSDLRNVGLRAESCDAVVVLDALGFFETDVENERVLTEAVRVLAPGRRLVLKVVNGEPILADFRHADGEERDGAAVRISCTLMMRPARIIERASVSGWRGHGEYERRQRLYQAEELTAAAMRSGLTPVDVFADVSGAVFNSATSPMIWLVGQRARAA